MAADELAPLTGAAPPARDRLSLRGALGVFGAAILLFSLSSFSAKSLFPRSQATTTQAALARENEAVVLLAEEEGNKAVMFEDEVLASLAPVSVTTEECTGDFSLPAVNGADLVAYWSLRGGEPAVYGSERYSTVYNRYQFFFSSRENMLDFEADPVKYLPAWGGFCSYGISHEIVWNAENLGPKSNPDYWLMVDDQLYLFRSSIPLGKFTKHLHENIAHGTEVWRTWFGARADEDVNMTPFNTACFCTEESCVDA